VISALTIAAFNARSAELALSAARVFTVVSTFRKAAIRAVFFRWFIVFPFSEQDDLFHDGHHVTVYMMHIMYNCQVVSKMGVRR